MAKKKKEKKKKSKKKNKEDEDKTNAAFVSKDELQRKAKYWQERHRESYFLFLNHRTNRMRTFSYYVTVPMESYMRVMGEDPDEKKKKGAKKTKKKKK